MYLQLVSGSKVDISRYTVYYNDDGVSRSFAISDDITIEEAHDKLTDAELASAKVIRGSKELLIPASTVSNMQIDYLNDGSTNFNVFLKPVSEA